MPRQTVSCSKTQMLKINGKSSVDTRYVIAASSLAITGGIAEINHKKIALHVETPIIQTSDASHKKEPLLYSSMKTNDKLALNVPKAFRGTCYSLIRLAARAL